jgi:DNA-binding transcriptional LysR family regulator
LGHADPRNHRLPDLLLLAGERLVPPAQDHARGIDGERWIFPPLAGLAGSAASDAFLANGLEVPRVSVIANSIRVRDRLLATGRYLAMAPGVELRFSNDKWTELKVLPVKFEVKPRPVGIVTLKNRSLGPAARIFAEEARLLSKRMMKSS